MNPSHPLPLLPPLKPGGNPILLIDNSTLDLYNNCAREGEYAHVQNWTSTGEKGALNFGAAAHEGWKFRYDTCGVGKVDDVTQTKQNELISEYFLNKPQSFDEFRSPSLCIELMERYNERYQDEQWTIAVNPLTKKPCVEQSVMVFLATLFLNSGSNQIDIYYTGRIDLIIKDSEGLAVLDHKTTFQFGRQFANTMSMTAQFLGYAWAIKKTFGVLPLKYIVNAIRVRRPTDKALLAEDFFRVRGDDADFQRLPFYITQQLVDEWEANTIALVKTILYHYGQGYYPMNRSACQRKYGACQFFEVCNCDLTVRPAILTSAAFQQNEWSPLNKVVGVGVRQTEIETETK